MKAEALRCDYCSGFVNPQTYKCDYCGTQYMKPKSRLNKSHEIKVVSTLAPVEVITVQKNIPLVEFKQMRDIGIPVEEYLRQYFAEQIVDMIADKIEIYEDFDITGYQKKYLARLRVVKPDFRF